MKFSAKDQSPSFNVVVRLQHIFFYIAGQGLINVSGALSGWSNSIFGVFCFDSEIANHEKHFGFRCIIDLSNRVYLVS